MYILLNSQELKQFLDINLKTVVTAYNKNGSLTNFDRIVLSKTVIKHLVDLNPEKMYYLYFPLIYLF